MTARDLLWLGLRRWYLMLAGAALTLAAMSSLLHQPGVYWTQLTVVLLSPTGPFYPNKIEDPQYTMAPMAGLIVSDWNGSNHSLLTASGDTTLYGEGLTTGVKVRLPNQGSQWLPLYTNPTIDVQVVGSDSEAVAREAVRVASQLDELLKQRQEAGGIASSMRMTTMTSPATPTVAYVAGSRPRTMLAVGLIGAVTTTTCVYWLERLLVRRHGRFRGAGSKVRDHRPSPEMVGK